MSGSLRIRPVDVALRAAPELVLQAHIQLMDRFLNAQREIMTAYLQGVPAGAAEVALAPPLEFPQSSELPELMQPAASMQPAVLTQPAALTHPAVPTQPAVSTQPASTQPAALTHPAQLAQSAVAGWAPGAPAAPDAPVPPPAATPPAGALTRGRLQQIISDRTGYPPSMLNDDLDLEADLGIDSIKRTEILGVALREMGVSLNERMEEATTARTIRRILAALSTATAPQPPVQPSAPALEATGS